MKIKSIGMFYETTHRQLDSGFTYNGNPNNRQNINGFSIVKKRNRAADSFSDLILNEFQGKKATPRPSRSGKTDRDASPLINKDEVNALKILNEYWA